MLDFSKFLDFSALFVALSGLLFATWYPQFQDLLGKPRPPMYRNRKTYIVALQSALLSKAIPLTLFLLAYLISLLGVALAVMHSSTFTLWPSRIYPPNTLFMLTYLLSGYLLIFTIVLLVRLTGAWWSAGSDRGTEPRITILR